MSTATVEKVSPLVNGIDTEQVVALVTTVAEDEAFGKFQFRANNQWIQGSRSRTSIQGFYAGAKEDDSRREALTVDTDQPAFLAGKNTAPNAVEHLLHALTSCLTTTLVYHASVQGIELAKIDVSAEGDMNVRGYFGLSETVVKGYECIRVEMVVQSDADVATLTALTMHSPVYDVVSRAVPSEFTLIKA